MNIVRTSWGFKHAQRAYVKHYTVEVLTTADPKKKVSLTHDFNPTDLTEEKTINENTKGICENEEYTPKRPLLPTLIDDDKQKMPTYKSLNVSLPVFLLHNTAHIELNAIDVTWHTMLLADHLHPNSMPEQFFKDFYKIASDEARHFSLLCKLLEQHNSFYGALPSHGTIWKSAQLTQKSLLSRICMTQLVQESRALDSGERLSKKFISCGDKDSAQLIETICEEEIEHVKIGVKWFKHVLDHVLKSNETYEDAFRRLVMENYGPIPIPLNEEARTKADLPRDWYYPISRHVIKTNKKG
ncbi:hypothetical protein AKO1_007840 [Acrasis kona]|uniref:Uncharacterized protein n=1 Tax=Acrasis kona TaxID=1008807 RepID=A0AAW2YNZ8_9EUKA